MNGTLEGVSIDEVIGFLESLGGVLTLRPQPGDGWPEAGWGDAFCWYAPDGVVPRTQPFATVVTRDHPGDEASRLDRPAPSASTSRPAGTSSIGGPAGTPGRRPPPTSTRALRTS